MHELALQGGRTSQQPVGCIGSACCVSQAGAAWEHHTALRVQSFTTHTSANGVLQVACTPGLRGYYITVAVRECITSKCMASCCHALCHERAAKCGSVLLWCGVVKCHMPLVHFTYYCTCGTHDAGPCTMHKICPHVGVIAHQCMKHCPAVGLAE
jgi:hypothetical protein